MSEYVPSNTITHIPQNLSLHRTINCGVNSARPELVYPPPVVPDSVAICRAY